MVLRSGRELFAVQRGERSVCGAERSKAIEMVLYMDAGAGGGVGGWSERLRSCLWNGATFVCVYAVCACAFVVPLPAGCGGTNGCG
jgi:hypothetical protein